MKVFQEKNNSPLSKNIFFIKFAYIVYLRLYNYQLIIITYFNYSFMLLILIFKAIISDNLKENRNIKYEKIIFNYIISYLIINNNKYNYF
jgi:hypothetical protein